MHPIIANSIVAVSVNDKKLINDVVIEICQELKIDPKIGQAFAEITLDQYNPQKFGIREGTVVTQLSIISKWLNSSHYKEFN